MGDASEPTITRHIPRGRRDNTKAPATTGTLEPLMTIDDVAEFLGIPRQTLYAWRCEGKGPRAHRVGKHLRYLPDDVRRWVEDQPA